MNCIGHVRAYISNLAKHILYWKDKENFAQKSPTSFYAGGHATKELSWQLNAAYSEPFHYFDIFNFEDLPRRYGVLDIDRNRANLPAIHFILIFISCFECDNDKF